MAYWMHAVVLGLVIFFDSGCSRIEYKSNGNVPVHFTGRRGHKQQFKAEGREQFFLWGFLPNKRTVSLDEKAVEAGFKQVSRLEIHEYYSFWDTVIFITSLGVYTPRSYRITGYGERE